MKPPAHLAHLATDLRGRPVPYINVIGTRDSPERWQVRYDRNVRTVCAFYLDDPGGEPNFLQQSAQRQRECAYLGRCQVCARPVDWPDRRLVISSVSIDVISSDALAAAGEQTAVVTEPWLCPDCADFATGVCPALIRRTSADDLVVIDGLDPHRCQAVLSKGWIDGAYEAATMQYPLGMWVKIHIPNRLAVINYTAARARRARQFSTPGLARKD